MFACTCHSTREICTVFNPILPFGRAATPQSQSDTLISLTTFVCHFMQCSILREKQKRVMFTYSHLWLEQENWICAESGIIDLDGCHDGNICAYQLTLWWNKWMKTLRGCQLHANYPVNTSTFHKLGRDDCSLLIMFRLLNDKITSDYIYFTLIPVDNLTMILQICT